MKVQIEQQTAKDLLKVLDEYSNRTGSYLTEGDWRNFAGLYFTLKKDLIDNGHLTEETKLIWEDEEKIVRDAEEGPDW